MQTRLINQAGQQRTFVVVLNSGDEVMASLKRFVEQEMIEAAQFSAIGAFRSAVLGYFDCETKQYQRIPVHEQVEVASFIGDIALYDQSQTLKNARARRKAITQRAVELLDCGRLASFSKRCQRAILPARVAPRGGNWDDLLVKTTRSWAKKA